MKDPFIFRENLDSLNSLSANHTKWSDTLKQFFSNLPTNYLTVFDDFVGLAFEGLRLIRFCKFVFTAIPSFSIVVPNFLQNPFSRTFEILKLICIRDLEFWTNLESFFASLLIACPMTNFGPLLKGLLHKTDVNHSIYSNLGPKITGSLITRLGP